MIYAFCFYLIFVWASFTYQPPFCLTLFAWLVRHLSQYFLNIRMIRPICKLFLCRIEANGFWTRSNQVRDVTV